MFTLAFMFLVLVLSLLSSFLVGGCCVAVTGTVVGAGGYGVKMLVFALLLISWMFSNVVDVVLYVVVADLSYERWGCWHAVGVVDMPLVL